MSWRAEVRSQTEVPTGQACAPLWHGVLFFAVSLAGPVELLVPLESWFNHINGAGKLMEIWHRRQKCTKNIFSDKCLIFCTKNCNLSWILNYPKEFHIEATVLYRVLQLILKIPVERFFSLLNCLCFKSNFHGVLINFYSSLFNLLFFHKEHCKIVTSMVSDISGMCHGICLWLGLHFISFNPFFGNLQPAIQAWKKDLSIYDGL